MNEDGPSETSHLFSECDNGQRAKAPSIEAKGADMDYGLFFTLMLGAFLAYADDTFVFTTHGTIASQFGTGTMGSWLVTAYNLGLAVSLPLYGRICDIYGYKYPIQGAYLLFSIGCAMSGFSDSLWIAIIGSFLSGAGGSGMTDLVVVIINDMVPPREATGLRSYVSIAMTIGVSVGAPLGGALTQWIGWRWGFILQISMSLVCLVMVSWRLRAARKFQNPENKPQASSQKDLNLRGIFLLGLCIASLMVFCQSFGELKSKSNLGMPILSTIFFASVLLFEINERHWTSNPLVPLQLVKTNGIGEIYLGQILLFFSYGGLCSHITEFWIRKENYVNTLASTTVLPIVFGNIISAAVSGRTIQRTGRYKKLLILNCMIVIASSLMIAARWPHRPILGEMICYLGLGLGVGGTLVCVFTALSVSVPDQMTATALTNYYLFQQLGLVLGVSVTSPVSQVIFKKYLNQEIPHKKDKSQLVAVILNDLRFAFTLPEPIQSIVKSCYLRSFRIIPAKDELSRSVSSPTNMRKVISATSLTLALLLFFRLPEMSLDYIGRPTLRIL